MSRSFSDLNDAHKFMDKVIDGLAIKNCLQIDDDGRVQTAWDAHSSVWITKEFRVDDDDFTYVVNAETDKVFRQFYLFTAD